MAIPFMHRPNPIDRRQLEQELQDADQHARHLNRQYNDCVREINDMITRSYELRDRLHFQQQYRNHLWGLLNSPEYVRRYYG